MAAIAGIGKIRDGALIRYASGGGDGEGVVVDQSDPTGWFNDDNVALLDITVQTLNGEREVELSGNRVREVVAEPGEHEHAPEDSEDADAAEDAPTEVVPDGPEDVREFADRHGNVEYAVTYTAGGEDCTATGTVDAVGRTLLHLATDDGPLGIPHSTITRIAVE